MILSEPEPQVQVFEMQLLLRLRTWAFGARENAPEVRHCTTRRQNSATTDASIINVTVPSSQASEDAETPISQVSQSQTSSLGAVNQAKVDAAEDVKPFLSQVVIDEDADPCQEDDEHPACAFIDSLELIKANPDKSSQWGDFVQTLNEFIDCGQKHVKLPAPKSYIKRKKQNPRDSVTIQKLYKRNRRRAIRLLTGGDPERCNLDHATLINHFCPDGSYDSPKDIFCHPPPAVNPSDSIPFTPEEVRGRFRRTESTVPGDNRLTYNHLRAINPDGRALCAIFNICLSQEKIPDSWKHTRTILIPKGDGGDQPFDWRPIAMDCTIAKLFASCVAARGSDCGGKRAPFRGPERFPSPRRGI